jgi:hypothetical protein
MQTSRDERSLGELFGDLTRQLSALMRQEIRLAKTEMTDTVSTAGKNVGFIAAGGALAYAGLLAIIAGIVLALALAIPAWLSALIVGIVVAIIGGLLIWKGVNTLRSTDMAPHETVETIQEDARWAKEQMS